MSAPGFATLRGRLLEVAERLGLQRVGRRHLSPCPACGTSTRGRSNPRPGALFLVGDGGWKCNDCGEGGDAATLIGFRVLGHRPEGRDDWRAVGEWGRAEGFMVGAHEPVATLRPVVKADPLPERQRPPERPSEARTVWSDARCPGPVPELLAWGRSGYGWTGAEVMRLGGWGMLGYLDGRGSLPWWAARWPSRGYRAVVPVYDAAGELVELRARYTGTDEAPAPGSKLAPKAGLFVGTAIAPCPTMRALLRAGAGARPGLLDGGEGWPVRWDGRLMLCEGETDLFALAVALDREGLHPTGEGWPALAAYGSGTWTDEIADRIPDCAEVLIFPDADEEGQGLKLGRKVRDTFARRGMRARLVDVAALAGRKVAA